MSMRPMTESKPSRLFSPEMLVNPEPLYRHLRETAPVYWDETLDAWFLSRYDDIAAALEDPNLSAERAVRFREAIGSEEFRPLRNLIAGMMVEHDPPAHTRLRGLVNNAFTPHVIAALAPRIQELIDRFLDRVRGQGRMDLIADLAFPLPGTVILELLGLPDEDLLRLKHWSDDYFAIYSADPQRIAPAVYARALQAAVGLTDYFTAAAAHCRSRADGGILKTLTVAAEECDRLSSVELAANAALLLMAGHETTTHLIGGGLLALLNHSDQWRRLRDDPTLLPKAIEELLRYVGPVQFLHFVARTDREYGGRTIRQGQMVYLLLGSGNRDPAQFPDADRLDIGRTPNHHLAFGLGRHYCLGAPLARLEAQMVFGTLLRRLPGVRLTGAALEYQENYHVRGLKALPVEFEKE